MPPRTTSEISPSFTATLFYLQALVKIDPKTLEKVTQVIFFKCICSHRYRSESLTNFLGYDSHLSLQSSAEFRVILACLNSDASSPRVVEKKEKKKN